jgi:hypoxanthine phosphoribosyltransferase
MSTTPETLDGETCPDYCKEVLHSEAQIQKRVRELAADISKHYEGKHLVVVGVLKGAFLFLSDLVRHLTVSHEVEFLAISSYGDSSKSSGNVRVNLDLRRDVKDKHVLVVEDIIDTGNTLHYLVEMLRGRHPASVEVCPFLTKKGTLKVGLLVASCVLFSLLLLILLTLSKFPFLFSFFFKFSFSSSRLLSLSTPPPPPPPFRSFSRVVLSSIRTPKPQIRVLSGLKFRTNSLSDMVSTLRNVSARSASLEF